MTASAGRTCLIKKGATTIAGCRTKGITWNGTPIDITSDDSNGVEEFLEGVMATDTLEITVDGVEEDGVLQTAALTPGAATKHFTDLTFVFPSGSVIAGKFVMTSYGESGPHDGPQTFTATFRRNGIHTLTAGT